MKVPNMIEMFIKSKKGLFELCGDSIASTESYIAVIDGATPKGTRLWNGKRGDVFVSLFIKNIIENMSPDLSASEAITLINNAVNEVYKENGTSYEELPAEERLQASIVIYSAYKREIWSFGDCKFRVNDKSYDTTRRADKLLSDLRALYIELARKEGIKSENDIGREAIMPFLKQAIKLANTDGEFGYDAINGGNIKAENTKIIPVSKGDFVVLASDGYPTLFDTLEKTEEYLFKMLKKDPNCIKELRSTKGLNKGNESFDDRSYISFYAK